MVCSLCKIRAKVRIFGELLEKCDKKAERLYYLVYNYFTAALTLLCTGV